MVAVCESSPKPRPIKLRGPQTPEEKRVYGEIYTHSRLWWPNKSPSEEDQHLYQLVSRTSAQRAQRICVPAPQEHGFYDRVILPALRKAEVWHARIPLLCEGEIWYFLDKYEDVKRLVGILADVRGPELSNRPPAPGQWRQRLKIPFAAEHYRAHLSGYLQDRGVRPARMLLEREGDVWYFLDTVGEVETMMEGLDAYRPVRRPDTGPLVEDEVGF